MKILLFFTALMMMSLSTYSQNLEVITLDKSKITTTVLDSSAKSDLILKFKGIQDNTLRKKWTARTFRLSDGRVILEFFDKQAVLIGSPEELEKLRQIRFVKNTIDFLKKNISYKIQLTYEQGLEIISKEKPDRLTRFVSDMPEHYNFEVYQLSTGQILFLNTSEYSESTTIYPDLKTLSSDNETVLGETYGTANEEYIMEKLASGDRTPDYEPNEHLIYPKYLNRLIKNHKLKLIEQKVYVSDFYGNLYKSENDYYVLVDEVYQENGAGNKMQILTLRIYDTVEQVSVARKRYEKFKNETITSEHFYQKISDKYGQDFQKSIPELIDKLPTLLNFDKDQLSFDSTGIELIDESLSWIGTDYRLFDSWFPSVLAYYGECYIKEKKNGTWTVSRHDKVWIPELILKNGNPAWDWINFYKDLYEGPVSLRWAGNWDNYQK